MDCTESNSDWIERRASWSIAHGSPIPDCLHFSKNRKIQWLSWSCFFFKFINSVRFSFYFLLKTDYSPIQYNPITILPPSTVPNSSLLSQLPTTFPYPRSTPSPFPLQERVGLPRRGRQCRTKQDGLRWGKSPPVETGQDKPLGGIESQSFLIKNSTNRAEKQF